MSIAASARNPSTADPPGFRLIFCQSRRAFGILIVPTRHSPGQWAICPVFDTVFPPGHRWFAARFFFRFFLIFYRSFVGSKAGDGSAGESLTFHSPDLGDRKRGRHSAPDYGAIIGEIRWRSNAVEVLCGNSILVPLPQNSSSTIAFVVSDWTRPIKNGFCVPWPCPSSSWLCTISLRSSAFLSSVLSQSSHSTAYQHGSSFPVVINRDLTPCGLLPSNLGRRPKSADSACLPDGQLQGSSVPRMPRWMVTTSRFGVQSARSSFSTLPILFGLLLIPASGSPSRVILHHQAVGLIRFGFCAT